MNYCISCMKELKDGARFCPFCGKEQAAAAPHHLPPGTVLRGRYRVGAALGEGGFGVTYRGLDTALDLRVAIKEFFPYGFVTRMGAVSAQVTEMGEAGKAEFFQKGKTRFMQEAKTLAKFSGARGIVEVRDFFEENNTAYIVMEYLDGVTLKQYLKTRGRLTPEETLRLLTPVMESLKLLHKENLIHRDISPDNIMLVGEEVKLLDFGAARSVDGDNKSLSVMLKPGYAPEEQYRSKGKQGPWTDVYALCATMYKCITGVRPDESPDRLDEDTLQAPSALGINISPQYEAALLKGLAVKSRDRWQTVDELLQALTAKAPAGDGDKTKIVFVPDPPKKETPPEKTLPVNPPKSPKIPVAEPLPPPKDQHGPLRLKIAVGAVAALVVIIIIVIAANSGRSPEPTYHSGGNANSDSAVSGTEVGDTYYFGTYRQDNDYEEEIAWKILAKEGNKALLISEKALDCLPYNTEWTDVTWETCSLRTWLNNDFYNAAFSESEKSRIKSTTVTADANPDYDTDPGSDTTDKVFLLSIDEVNEYFSSDEARKCAPTDYAKDQGASTSDSYTTSDGKATCWWWLRSPGNYSIHAAFVNYVGSVDSIGYFVDYLNDAVRPALWINLES